MNIRVGVLYSSSKNHIPACHPKWVGHLGTIMRKLSNLDAVVGHLLTSTTWTKWTSAAITTIIATVVVVAESSIACASAVACTACENPRSTTPCGNSRAAISYRTLRAATACWDPRPLSPTRIPGPLPISIPLEPLAWLSPLVNNIFPWSNNQGLMIPCRKDYKTQYRVHSQLLKSRSDIRN